MVEETQSSEDVLLSVFVCYGSRNDLWFRLDSNGNIAVLSNLE
jgi:hypothetical protein